MAHGSVIQPNGATREYVTSGDIVETSSATGRAAEYGYDSNGVLNRVEMKGPGDPAPGDIQAHYERGVDGKWAAVSDDGKRVETGGMRFKLADNGTLTMSDGKHAIVSKLDGSEEFHRPDGSVRLQNVDGTQSETKTNVATQNTNIEGAIKSSAQDTVPRPEPSSIASRTPASRGEPVAAVHAPGAEAKQVIAPSDAAAGVVAPEAVAAPQALQREAAQIASQAPPTNDEVLTAYRKARAAAAPTEVVPAKHLVLKPRRSCRQLLKESLQRP